MPKMAHKKSMLMRRGKDAKHKRSMKRKSLMMKNKNPLKNTEPKYKRKEFTGTKGIALGNHSSLFETKRTIKAHKERLKWILKKHGFKINPSKFKFHYAKSTNRQDKYPFFSYVDTPHRMYNWIFIT